MTRDDRKPAALDPALLTEHVEWIRRVAVSLARDVHEAEDLCQEACLVALRSPAPAQAALRAWLAKLVLNLARGFLRGDARRRGREAVALAAGSAQSEEELVEVVRIQRRIVDELIALEEPYRGALILRYHHGLAPSAIAARQGIPLATVKTRLRRGLEKLRARLGDERGRPLAVVLLSKLPQRALRPAGRSAGVGAPIALRLAAAVASGLLAFALVGLEAEPHAGPLESRAALRAPGAEPRLAIARAPAREPAAHVHAAPTADAPRATLPLRGRAIDLDGRPVAACRVEFVAGDAQICGGEPALHAARSGADGEFVLEVPPQQGFLRAADPCFATVMECVADPCRGDVPALVVVAPARALHGALRDVSGAPVAGATVRAMLRTNLRTALGIDLDRAFPVELATRSDALGDFRFGALPLAALRSIEVEKVGYLPGDFAVDERVSGALELVLARAGAGSGLLLGRVVDPRGIGVGGAWVRAGARCVETEDDGTFQLAPEPDAREVLACAPGQAPARRALSSGVEEELVLELGGLPAALRGRVLRPTGEPVAGACVALADAEPFGELARRAHGAPGSEPRSLESILSPDGRDFTFTDARGEFALEGLLEREYRLELLDLATLERCVTAPLRADCRDLVLYIADPAPRVRIRGRVVDASGTPLAGVRVAPGRAKLGAASELASRPARYGAACTSDARGRFEFSELPARDLVLALHGPADLRSRLVRVSEDLASQELELELYRTCAFRTEVGELPTGADAFGFADEHGQALLIEIRNGLVWERIAWVRVRAGQRLRVCTIEERARELLLYAGGRVVQRFPVALAAGELTTLELGPESVTIGVGE